MVTQTEALVKLLEMAPILRARELAAQGIARVVLRRAEVLGLIERVGRGLYARRNADFTEHRGLAEIAKRVPRGVICLLSALAFHEISTQQPFKVWLAISLKATPPKFESPPLRIVRFSAKTLAYGVTIHDIDGVPVPITTPAKTVADCFKFRNKVGLEVALDALKDYRRDKRGTQDDLWKAAEVCRVTRVLKPYLEALA